MFCVFLLRIKWKVRNIITSTKQALSSYHWSDSVIIGRQTPAKRTFLDFLSRMRNINGRLQMHFSTHTDLTVSSSQELTYEYLLKNCLFCILFVKFQFPVTFERSCIDQIINCVRIYVIWWQELFYSFCGCFFEKFIDMGTHLFWFRLKDFNTSILLTNISFTPTLQLILIINNILTEFWIENIKLNVKTFDSKVKCIL